MPSSPPPSNNNRDELNSLRSDRYFFGGIGSVSFRRSATETEKIVGGRRRRSLNFPIGNHGFPNSKTRDLADEKKIKQPISPGKRLANMLSSFLYHSGIKKKMPTASFNEGPIRRHSEDKGASAKVTLSLYSQVETRDEPLAVLARRYDGLHGFMEREEICGDDHGIVVGKWAVNKRGEGPIVEDRMMWGGGYNTTKRMFVRREELEDGEESDSSSDLFELPHYCLLGGEREPLPL